MLRSAVANVFRSGRAAAPKTLVSEFVRTFLPIRSVTTVRGSSTVVETKRGSGPIVGTKRDSSTTVGTERDSSTIDDENVLRFSALAKDWWDIYGPLKALHSFNVVRVPWIRDRLRPNYKPEPGQPYLPLKGLSVIDVGCGAGILSEPLARLGAKVFGIDANEKNIEAAIWHRDRQPDLRDRIEYVCGSLDDENVSNRFDVLVASEVLEHVANRANFVEKSVAAVKSGGSIFFTTLNQTIASKVFGIWAAENVLRIVPKGIHEWEKFTPPNDLRLIFEKENCKIRAIHGFFFNPLTNRWAWSRCDQINYGLYAVKL